MENTVREQALQYIREERERQVQVYGTNEDLDLGFGPDEGWLTPYTSDQGDEIQRAFRRDYEEHESFTGAPTWMHLIREEVAELFESEDIDDTLEEAIQVAALCVSLVETLVKKSTVSRMSEENYLFLTGAYESASGGFSLTPCSDDPAWYIGKYDGNTVCCAKEVDGLLYWIAVGAENTVTLHRGRTDDVGQVFPDWTTARQSVDSLP